MPRKRRHTGEDSIYRVCRPEHGCPPIANGGRADHSCRAPWAYAIDAGIGPNGRRGRRVVTAKTKAELTIKVAALKENLAVGVTPTAQTVGGWLDYWVLRVAPDSIRASTLKGYRSKIELYLKPSLGRIKLQELTPEHVEQLGDWMRTLDKARLKGNGTGQLSETTVRQTHMILRSALAEALTRRKIKYNPAAVVRAPKSASNPHETLALADAKKVLKVASTERELCRLVVALALGVRQGEALGLLWSDYIRATGESPSMLRIQESVQRIDGELTRTGVKSRASHRWLPIPDRMTPIFDAWQQAAVIGEIYIFPGPNGGPCDAKRDWSDWRAALARAGVPLVPLHGARGSAASLLADMGVPDWRIAEILGHSQVSTTLRHYIRGTQESHQVAIDGLIGQLLP